MSDQTSPQTTPRSIGIIMDGNRRWATKNNLPKLEGHRVGYNKLREVQEWCQEVGVKHLIVYAFSTENWNRTKEEVGYLMNLLRTVMDSAVRDAIKNNGRLIFIGERSRLDVDIVRAMEDAEARTQNGSSFTLGIALSYGGRAEIIDAIRRIPEEKLSSISEDEFSRLLWTNQFSDTDLIIRTSGEERLSNFLPWQSVYSELFFTKTLWPDFTKEEFLKILGTFGNRERRLGK